MKLLKWRIKVPTLQIKIFVLFVIVGLGLANLRQMRSYLAAHMSETDRELATALLSKQEKAVLQEANREGDSKRQRKLARMQALRQAKEQGTENGLGQSLMVSYDLFILFVEIISCRFI